MSNTLLSIAIPTVNRKLFLELTLNEFLPQIRRNFREVELVISNNASEDDTDLYISNLIDQHKFLKYLQVLILQVMRI
mgnify:CR=1 FL=1